MTWACWLPVERVHGRLLAIWLLTEEAESILKHLDLCGTNKRRSVPTNREREKESPCHHLNST